MNAATLAFAREHSDSDTARLLLGRAPEGVDLKQAAQQIEGLRTAARKWPGLLRCEGFVYPPRVNREQASSEATAAYKASFARGCARVADLTGGMGVDSAAFAAVAGRVDYVERDPSLCSLAEGNFFALGLSNVSCHCDDGLRWLASCGEGAFGLVYIDPSRRSQSGRRVAAFEDCTPDITASVPLLLSFASRLLVKASPMIDIVQACRQLGGVDEVHVVAVGGECRELLFLCGGGSAEPTVHCVDLAPSHRFSFSFAPSQEAATPVRLSDVPLDYIFDPNAALMKAGCFGLLGSQFGLCQLDPSTRLFTSSVLPSRPFPGRVLRVVRPLRLDARAVRGALPEGRAHVVTRNFPREAAALQRELGLKEGGDLFVVAATAGGRRVGLLCERVEQPPCGDL